MGARKQDAPSRTSSVNAKTDNQSVYCKALRKGTITLCTGPAGTGKTFLACHAAHQMLQEGKVNQVMLVRPLVSCGKKDIGTLPGELSDKIGPYMQPLMDAFGEFALPHEIERLVKTKKLVMQPLELTRGMTIKDTFVICDEAQNAEYGQLHMLLTRIGTGSRFVLTGDASQADLPGDGENPLVKIIRRFRSETPREILICHLTREDIQRHPLIQWMDERLSGEMDTPQCNTISSIHCTECNKRVYYSLEDAGGFDVEQIECWNCKAVLDMGDDEVFATDIKLPVCQKSYPSSDF